MIRICSSIIDFGIHTDITNGKPDFTNLDEVVAEIDVLNIIDFLRIDWQETRLL